MNKEVSINKGHSRHLITSTLIENQVLKTGDEQFAIWNKMMKAKLDKKLLGKEKDIEEE